MNIFADHTDDILDSLDKQAQPWPWVKEAIGKGDIDTAYLNGLKEGERLHDQHIADLQNDVATLRVRLAKLSEAVSKFEKSLSSYCDGPERDELNRILHLT